MNWVREFERWAPKLRVVPFYGEKDARDIIKEFELFHESPPSGHLGIKFHVLVTTYDTITNSKGTGSIFKYPPRWEVFTLELSRLTTLI
jgi:SNF2 family DNA or RNA helicase